MAQSLEQLPSVVAENTLSEAESYTSGGKISNKIVFSDHIHPELNSPSLTFNLDLSKLNRRNREIKLTKVTHGIGKINISPRSKVALVHIRPIAPANDQGIDEGEVQAPLGSGKRVASTALAATSDEDSDSGSDIIEANVEHDYAHRCTSPTHFSQDHDHEGTGNDSGIGGSVCDSVELSGREQSDLNVSWSPVSDHDYENVCSPGNSSTASGPTYTRQPGFSQHAHEVSQPKNKKKKTVIPLWKGDGLTSVPTPPTRSKPKRGW